MHLLVLTPRLLRRQVAMSLDEPRAVIAVLPLQQGEPEFLDGLEWAQPERLLLERANDALRSSAALGSPHEVRARLDSEELQLPVECAAHVLWAVVVTQSQAADHRRALGTVPRPDGLR